MYWVRRTESLKKQKNKTDISKNVMDIATKQLTLS